MLQNGAQKGLAVQKTDVKFLNVVDDRWPKSYSTIIYTGGLRPCSEGFLYSFRYETGKGGIIRGAGIVKSEKYSKMSSEEIELMCAVVNPPSPDDIYKACIGGYMTKTYAEKYSGIAEAELGYAR